MKNRIFVTIATLLVTTGLLLPVAAQDLGGANGTQRQPKNPPGPRQTAKEVPPAQIKVPIKCLMGSGDVLAKVLGINNTGQTIKKGKVIYYSTSWGTNGSFTLDADLPAGRSRNIGQANYSFTCQAWFFKK